jgi:LysR family transcriptional regulator of abg operon
LDLIKLERMVAIYDAGSFRKAAKKLGMSQPTLTWSIHQLEESLNVQLFERGSRGIRATDVCERLVRRARLIFREQARMMDEVADSSHNQIVNVGVHSVFLTPAFAECVKAFSTGWSGVTLRIREGFSSDLIERLLRGELDFACCALPDDSEHGGELRAEPLASLDYSIVARADHPVFADIAAGGPVAEYPWVEFDNAIVGAFPGGGDIDEIKARAGRNTGRESVRTASMNLVKLLISQGEFIGLIADQAVGEELQAGTLKRLPGTMITASRFGFLNPAEDFETNAVQAFKKLLEDNAFSAFAG